MVSPRLVTMVRHPCARISLISFKSRGSLTDFTWGRLGGNRLDAWVSITILVLNMKTEYWNKLPQASKLPDSQHLLGGGLSQVIYLERNTQVTVVTQVKIKSIPSSHLVSYTPCGGLRNEY